MNFGVVLDGGTMQGHMLYIKKISGNTSGCMIMDEFCDVHLFKCSNLSLVKRLCKQYGSSYNFRLQQAKIICSGVQKIPIVVKELQACILFPLGNRNSVETLWINYGMVKCVKNLHYSFCEIHFKNGAILCIHQNARSVQGQMKRCKKIMKFLEQM